MIAADVPGCDRKAIGVTAVDPEDAQLCARLIARYAKSPDDGDLLADVLGIDVPRSAWRCPHCAYPLGSIGHQVACEPDLTAARLHLLAESAGRTP